VSGRVAEGGETVAAKPCAYPKDLCPPFKRISASSAQHKRLQFTTGFAHHGPFSSTLDSSADAFPATTAGLHMPVAIEQAAEKNAG